MVANPVRVFPLGVVVRNGALALLFLLSTVASVGAQATDRERKLADSVAYLKNIPEVAWVEVEGNDVYVGFKERPADLRLIISAAAVHGNRAIGFGVHVWAVPAEKRGWRPGQGPYYDTVTARHGKVERR